MADCLDSPLIGKSSSICGKPTGANSKDSESIAVKVPDEGSTQKIEDLSNQMSNLSYFRKEYPSMRAMTNRQRSISFSIAQMRDFNTKISDSDTVINCIGSPPLRVRPHSSESGSPTIEQALMMGRSSPSSDAGYGSYQSGGDFKILAETARPSEERRENQSSSPQLDESEEEDFKGGTRPILAQMAEADLAVAQAVLNLQKQQTKQAALYSIYGGSMIPLSGNAASFSPQKQREGTPLSDLPGAPCNSFHGLGGGGGPVPTQRIQDPVKGGPGLQTVSSSLLSSLLSQTGINNSKAPGGSPNRKLEPYPMSLVGEGNGGIGPTSTVSRRFDRDLLFGEIGGEDSPPAVRSATCMSGQNISNSENVFGAGLRDPLALERAARLNRSAAASNDPSCTWKGQLPPRQRPGHQPSYSNKIFLGGVPWDITETSLIQAFAAFGGVRVEWPGRDSLAPPRGYLYLVFENEDRVKELLAHCTHDLNHSGSYFFKISSRKMRSKEVQIIPWSIADSNYVRYHSPRLDPQKTVFVGALHGMINAQSLALIFNDLFGGVVYAGLDTDKHKYPIGSGRVTFNNAKSYMKAVAAAFIEIKTDRFSKKVQVDPYLEDALCCLCAMKQGPYFCRDMSCFSYFCRSCWDSRHNSPNLSNHKPLMRNIRGLTRARLHSVLDPFQSHTFMDYGPVCSSMGHGKEHGIFKSLAPASLDKEKMIRDHMDKEAMPQTSHWKSEGDDFVLVNGSTMANAWNDDLPAVGYGEVGSSLRSMSSRSGRILVTGSECQCGKEHPLQERRSGSRFPGNPVPRQERQDCNPRVLGGFKPFLPLMSYGEKTMNEPPRNVVTTSSSSSWDYYYSPVDANNNETKDGTLSSREINNADVINNHGVTATTANCTANTSRTCFTVNVPSTWSPDTPEKLE